MRSSQCASGHPTLSRSSRTLGLIALLVLLVVSLAPIGLASDQGKTITLGESNNAAQRRQLLDDFQATSNDKVLTVTVEDTARAMDGIFDMSGITTAYSSTALTCRDLGEGLDVTTRNINLVTPGLYAMALVTAGIGDATLVVAAPDGLASVEGMTALTGVFETWDIAPCASGNTSRERQRLALEELTLTAQIGLSFRNAGVPDGVQKATNVVLQAQQTIVTDKLTDRAAIARAITDQERNEGVSIPPDQRAQLVDLMTRLANEDIDWSTFSAGWTIVTSNDNTQITMTGDGIAIRNARATATAEAGAILTATAQAEAAFTATADAAAQMTATAEADAALTATAEAANLTATANAQATQDAIAALTATAAAQPTATPTPLPTATPAPFSVTGNVVEKEAAGIVITGLGAEDAPIAYKVDADARITRDGETVDLDQIGKGDAVELVVDGNTRNVITLKALPAPLSLMNQLGSSWPLGALGLLLPTMLWYRRRRTEEPFIITPRGAA